VLLPPDESGVLTPAGGGLLWLLVDELLVDELLPDAARATRIAADIRIAAAVLLSNLRFNVLTLLSGQASVSLPGCQILDAQPRTMPRGWHEFDCG
jgi:hypothetical protein